MKYYLALCLLTAIAIWNMYEHTYHSDKEYRGYWFPGTPLKCIKPKSFIRHFLICKDRHQGMINIAFYQQMLTHFIVVIALIWLWVVFENQWYLNGKIAMGQMYALAGITLFFYIIPSKTAVSINFRAQKKYMQENPKWEAKRYGSISSSKRKIFNPKVGQTNDDCRKPKRSYKDVRIQAALTNKLKKYCYHKEKGIYYILFKDIERIKTKELAKYRKIDQKIEVDKNGKQIFKVFDKKNEEIIFQAPIKM